MTPEHELDQVIERIQKLLALTKSSNPHEAALAAAKAQALLFRHNLSMATVQAGLEDGASPYIADRFHIGGGTTWRRMLLAAIARNNFCRAVGYKGTPEVGIVGERHNIQVVQYLYGFLVAEIRRLAERGWAERRREGEARGERAWKRSFYYGAVQMVSQRLAAQHQASAGADSASTALVALKSRELDVAYAKFFPKVNPGRRAVVRSDDGYAAGVRAARRIALNQPLDADASGAPQLATGRQAS